MSFLKSISLFPIIFLVSVAGTRYQFIFDNDEIFDNCPEMPDNNGIHDVADLTEMIFEFAEGSIKCNGNVTCIWEGVQPTDRIEVRSEVYKFQRGAWQPTPFTIAISDFCKKQFDVNSIWYQTWSNVIPEDERICINNFGVVYHQRPFEVDTVFDFVINMEGRHKIVVYLMAFDEQNVKRSKIICYQIFGEYVKVK